MSNGILFHAEAVRFGGWEVAGKRTVSITAKMSSGDGGYFSLEFLQPVDRTVGRSLSSRPLAFEMWTANIKEGERDEKHPWIYCQYALVRWKHRKNGILAGETMEGPALHTRWCRDLSETDLESRGFWCVTRHAPPKT